MTCPSCNSCDIFLQGVCLKCGHNTLGDASCERCGARIGSGDSKICSMCQDSVLSPVTPGLDALKAFDDKDTRHEVYRMLDLIGEDGRRRFLLWCVDQVRRRDAKVVVESHAPDTMGCMLDICILVMQYNLPSITVLMALEQFTKKGKIE